MRRNQLSGLRSRRNPGRIRIQGCNNFRDLGGYTTGDGRKVKQGLLFRSAHLADLTARGLEQLGEFGLGAIIDFRSEFETERRPDRVPENSQAIHLPVMDFATREMRREIRQRLERKDFAGFNASEQMREAYRQFPVEFTPAYKAFMETVRDAGARPVLWHCTAGKDRTGYAAAILLRMLGVEQAAIYEDYVLSNRYVKRINKQVVAMFLARGIKAYRMIRPLLGVEESWLRASFESIDKEWGSFDAYLKGGLGLSDSDILGMQDSLLE